ncbi:unnamed protein product [Parnassius mnemosyne]|uniref:Replication factor C subunit 1 n=1 Tax=Parnassius mnemosyne TaxID=213953 RepID=A0AAV1LY67_9NEOP
MNIINKLQDDAGETNSSTIFAVLFEEFVKKETPSKQFEIEVFVVIIGALDKRIKAYQNDIRSFFKVRKPEDGDSDIIPESPQVQIKNKAKRSRRKRALSDDSDESSPKEKVKKKSGEKGLRTKEDESSKNTLKEVKTADLFGNGVIKRSEPLLKKHKATESGIHSDNEFEMSLLELDEIEEQNTTNCSNKKETGNASITDKIVAKEIQKNDSPSKSNTHSVSSKEEHLLPKNEKTNEVANSKETKKKIAIDSSCVDNIKTENNDIKEGAKKADFSEFIESHDNIAPKENTPKSKKRKLDKSLNESVLTDEEKHERRSMSAALYKNYLNRSGPKHLGAKELPQGSPDCLKDCAFVLTGVLDSFEKEEIANAITNFGGCVKSSVTKKVTHVLAGEDAGPAKMAKAQELGIKIINEDEFLQMITNLSNNMQKSKVNEISEPPKKHSKKNYTKSPTDRKMSPKTKTSKVNNQNESKIDNFSKQIDVSKSGIKIENKYDCNLESKSNRDKKASTDNNKSEVEKELNKDIISNDKIVEDNNDQVVDKLGKPENCSSILKSSEQTPSSMLWVDKYKPQNVKQIIGQHGAASNVKKLSDWLMKWYANRKAKLPKPNPWAKNDDGGYYKAALLSGPPGVGKTTTVSLVCKELGFDVVEFNASDTRNKTLIKEQIGELLTTTSLSAYARGDTGKQAVTKKHVLVMDEVDGMAGNEDRGGLQELIGLIKSTSVPIICMCNDRNSQKMRSLVNYCYDLRFSRPRVDQIKSAMMSICFKEGIKIPPDVLAQLITAAGQDVRQTLHLMSVWAIDPKLADAERLRNEAKNIKRDIKLGPWEAVRKVFSAEEHKNMSINDKSDLFFYDYSLAPLFVQENYLQVVPHCPKDKVLERVSMAADSISLGDLVEARIRGSQAWHLLPVQAMYSSVIPGHAMAGHVAGQIQFPGWLGKNSRASKMQRLGQEIHAHTRLSTSGSKSSIFLDYCTHLRDAVVTPMLKDKADGISQSLDVLESYHLLREDLDSLIELSLWPGQRNPMILVESKVKAAMTRAYNKRASALPYAPAHVRRARTSRDTALDDDDEDATDELPDDSDPEADALIKKKKTKDDKPSTKEKPSTSKEKTRKK